MRILMRTPVSEIRDPKGRKYDAGRKRPDDSK